MWYQSMSFMLGVALQLGRPLAVFERSKRSYLDPARVYGAHDAEGNLIHLGAKPKQPETVPTFQFVPINELLARLHAHPTSHSIIEFNGKNHFDPWVLRRQVRAQAMAAEEAEEAEAKAKAAAEEAVEEEAEAEAEEAEAAEGSAEEAIEEEMVQEAVEEMAVEEMAATEMVATPMAQAPPALSRTGRERKRKQRFEDSDASDLKAAASSFRSAPALRRQSIPNDVANDTSGIEVGQAVLARGFAPSGERVWFKAEVTALRPPRRWPPIVVKFTATHPEGDTQPLLLPRPITAYVHRADLDTAVE